jgi:hypothetical protein
MKPPRCQVCQHADRAKIEVQMANGVGIDTLADRFSLHRQALWRHKRFHMTEDQLRRLKLTGYSDPRTDLEALKRTETESLLANLISERVRQARIADAAEADQQWSVASKASGELVRTLKTIGTLLGEIHTGNTTINNQFNLLIDPQWLEIRRAITQALRPHPVALRAVADALQTIEHRPLEKPVEALEAHVIS